MVEILLAVYNGEKFLKEQLNSIFNQSYSDWKLTIYDDGSDDKTNLIVSYYMNIYEGKIRLIRSTKNSGSAKKAFKNLLALSSGDYVAFCDHDDVWDKDKLKISVETIKKLEKEEGDIPILIHTDLFVVDENLKLMWGSMFKAQNFKLKEKSFNKLLVQNNITGCTVLMNRSLVEVCGKISDSAVMHDWWVGLVAAAFGRIYLLKEKTVYYRQHEKNCVGARDAKGFRYVFSRFLNREEVLKNKKDSYIQAKAFLEQYKDVLSERNIKILNKYLNTQDYKGLRKIFSLIFGGFLKEGLIRKFGQFFFV